jgi:hypothetical protein
VMTTREKKRCQDIFQSWMTYYPGLHYHTFYQEGGGGGGPPTTHLEDNNSLSLCSCDTPRYGTVLPSIKVMNDYLTSVLYRTDTRGIHRYVLAYVYVHKVST